LGRSWQSCWHSNLENWEIQGYPVDKKEYGRFYNGDSYICLNTYKNPESDKLLYNVHFWLGKNTSQDEAGVAAYKTVELDDLLGDLPVQYREVEQSESPQFLDLFGGQIQLMEGGIDSGFNHIKPAEYKPRLLHIKGTQKALKISEVKCAAASLNTGDVFVLDLGLQIIQWNGKTAGIFEKRKANEIIQNLKKERNGKPTSLVLDDLEDNEVFWGALGGKPKPGQIAAATSDDIKVEKCKYLFEVSDKVQAGVVEMKKIAEGAVKKNQLDTKEVFILDIGHTIYSWIGKGASKAERANGIKFATDYLAKLKERSQATPIVRVLEGAEPKGFLAEFS